MRWFIRISLFLAALIALAVAAIFVVPSDRIARLATEQFTASTGRALEVSGDVRPTLFPQIGVRVEGVTLANAPWSTQGPMVEAEALSVGVDVVALLGGVIDIKRMDVVRPRIILERAADGQVNWDLLGATAAPPEASGTTASTVPQVALAMGEITDGALLYVDHAAGTTQRVEAVDLTVRMPDMGGVASAVGSGLYNGATVAFEAEVASLRDLLAAAPTQVALSLSAGGTEAALSGAFTLDTLRFDGRVTAQSQERAMLFAALGQTPPDLPEGLGRDRVAVTTGVLLEGPRRVALTDLELTLDGNTLRGDLALSMEGARPRITADLQSAALDLRGLSAQGRGAAAPAPASTGGWSTAPIDVSPLGLLDAQIDLRSGAVSLGDATLDAVTARIVLEDRRAVMTLAPVRAYGGAVTGEIIVNGRGGLSSRVNLALDGFQMQPFLTEFIDYDRLVGEANIAVNVLAVGQTMDALMRSLDGAGQMSIGNGELIGLDLAGMLRNLDTSFRGEGSKTIFDGISGSFTLSAGVLSNQDLSFVAPLATAEGAGLVNIGAQTLDYRLVPSVLSGGDGGAGVSVPVLITGTWAAPRFRPDLGALLNQGLSEEKAALEAAAKAKLAEELEIAPEGLVDREAIEDAVKERVEDQVRGLLGNILGGN